MASSTSTPTTAPADVDRQGGPPDDGLSLDEVYHLLQNERRRLTLQHLLAAGASDLETVTRYVATAENDVSAEELTEKERKRVYISLYQSHLPSLADHEVVAYDQGTGTVTPTDRIDRFEPYLVASTDDDAGPSEPDSGTTAVVAVAVVGAGLLALLLQFVATSLEGIVVGLLVAGALAVAALGLSNASRDFLPV
jgi:hypothetical protein